MEEPSRLDPLEDRDAELLLTDHAMFVRRPLDSDPARTGVFRIDLESGVRREVAGLFLVRHPFGRHLGFSVSPDGDEVIYTHVERSDSDVMWVTEGHETAGQ